MDERNLLPANRQTSSSAVADEAAGGIEHRLSAYLQILRSAVCFAATIVRARKKESKQDK
jgi:hypothetical protein